MAEEKKVKVKLNPLCNIGGYGKAGDVVDMLEADAKRYQKEGLVTILSKKDAAGGDVVPSSAANPE